MHLGHVLLLTVFFVLFSWLFYKGYTAYKKNGWDDPFFKSGDDSHSNQFFQRNILQGTKPVRGL